MASSSNIHLAPLSALYGAVTRTRLALYRTGILPTRQISVPVISVGNITTGGTGKTPLVSWLARQLASAGHHVCIVTRGYGRSDSSRQVVVSDGQRVLADATEGGDEPRLLAESLLNAAAVISNADRISAANWAIEHLNSNVIVLDDAFQHLSIARDLNLVTIDSTNPWGGRFLLPRGRLREPLKGLSRADAIIVTRANLNSQIESLREELFRLSGGRPVILSQMISTRVKPLGSDNKEVEKKRVSVSPQQPVLAFCALGNPNSFFRHVAGDGHEVIKTVSFRDHYVYTQRDVDELCQKARACGARSIVTTAKDAVKLRELRFDIPCFVIEIDMKFDDEKKVLDLVNQAIQTARLRQSNPK